MHAVVGVIPQARGETVFIASVRYRTCDSSTYFRQYMDEPSINIYVAV